MLLLRAFPTALASISLASLLQLSAGCASTGPDQAQETAASMSALETSLHTTSSQIATTIEALNKVVAQADADLRPEYDAYTTALSGLESTAKTVATGAAAMREKAQAYYVDWEKNQASIQDPDIKKTSEARRIEMQKSQEEANQRAQAFQQRCDAFAIKLRDIHSALGHDLNTAGVESITGQVKAAAGEGKEIRETIDKLAAKLAEVRKAISAQGPATPPPGA